MGVNGVALVVCSQFGGENTWVEGERRGLRLLKNWLAVEKKLGHVNKTSWNYHYDERNVARVQWLATRVAFRRAVAVPSHGERVQALSWFVATYFRYLVTVGRCCAAGTSVLD